MSGLLEQLELAGLVSGTDGQLARALGRRVDDPSPEVLAAAALASRQLAAGHVCVELGAVRVDVGGERADPAAVAWPEPATWLRLLASSPLVASGAGIDEPRPLVLDGQRLYLRRHWDDQRRLAEALLRRAAAPPADPVDPVQLSARLDRLHPPARALPPATPAAGGAGQLSLDFARRPAPVEPAGVDWQRVATWTAAVRRLCVISGGPGTGKTSTVARLLELGIEQALAAGRPAPRTLLLAPTGKAAARMLEALRGAVERNGVTPAVRAALPDAAFTLHRALGLRPSGRRPPRYGPGQPLPADVVVVDEASMVDLALMTRLVEAVSPRARLILLGDPDQLASVEAGAVLGDLCAAAGERSEAPDEGRLPDAAAEGLAGCVVHLRASRRYGADSGIGRLALAVREGDAEAALALLDDEGLPDVQRLEPASSGPGAELLRGAVEGYAPLLRSDAEAEALEGYRLLCALRRGPFGVEALNRAVGRALFGREIDPEMPPPGAPLMVTRNDPEQELYNGDIGRVERLADGSANLVLAAADGGLRRVALARLPEHELVLAMSVHKSQGSEFDRIDLVLPLASSPLLTRELVYTAITRARQSLRIFASRAALAEAVERRVRRSSGLAERLRGGSSG